MTPATCACSKRSARRCWRKAPPPARFLDWRKSASLVGSTVIASFTIQTRYGTIYGSGRAALHSSGRYASFGGSLSVSHGTGSYAHAHGGGKLYGVIDRRTSALTVQTVGTLSY